MPDKNNTNLAKTTMFSMIFLVKASAGVYQYVKREFDKKRGNCDVLAGSNVSRKKVLVIVKRGTKLSIRVSSATPKTKVRATPCGVARRFFCRNFS